MSSDLERRGLRFRKAFGAAANGTIVSGVQGAVIGLGVGAGVALAVEARQNSWLEQLQVDWRVRFFGAGKAVQALAGSIRSNKGATSTNLSAQINGNSYDINKLQKTQPYTYAENVSSIKETIAQNGPNAVPPIEIRVHNEQVLVVDGHHRLEAFRQLGYDRVPIKYLHSSQLGKTFPNGTYYRSIQELLDTIDIKS